MRVLQFPRDCANEATKLIGQFPAPSHADKTITENMKILATDGSTICLLLRSIIPKELLRGAYKSWRKVKQTPKNRSTAVGSQSLQQIKRNGTLSEWRAVPARVLAELEKIETAQGLLGYQHGCKTPLTTTHPGMLTDHKGLLRLVDQIYADHFPSVYARQKTIIKAADCSLSRTAFTSIYIAKNFRTAYHLDSGNLPGSMTALMPMGKFEGGELVIPRLRVAIDLEPGDLLFFDPQQVHGNLPIEGMRISAAFYCEDYRGPRVSPPKSRK